MATLFLLVSESFHVEHGLGARFPSWGRSRGRRRYSATSTRPTRRGGAWPFAARVNRFCTAHLSS